MYQFNREEYNKRMEWYVDARFGMFIHWGLYALPARHEWVKNREEIPEAHYQKYFEHFSYLVQNLPYLHLAKSEYGLKYRYQPSLFSRHKKTAN